MKKTATLHYTAQSSASDWHVFQNLMHQTSRRVSLKSYLTNQVTDLCKNVAIPLLERASSQPAQRKIIKEVQISEMLFKDIQMTNLEILKLFAEHKQMSINKIVSMYLIDNRIMAEEAKFLKQFHR